MLTPIKTKFFNTVIFKILIFFLLFGMSGLGAWAQENLITSVTILVSCGDGQIDGLEVCDPGTEANGWPPALSGLTCVDFGWEEGNLTCLPDCTDYDDTNCFTCGNGIKEPAEMCEGNDFGGDTCISQGFIGGYLICTQSCQISLQECIANPVQGGGGGGGGPTGGNPNSSSGFNPGSEIPANETKVTVRGKAYAESDVHILVDGKVLGIVKTDTLANFYFETDEVVPGVASFGFWSEDKEGLKSTMLSLTFRVTAGAATNISGVYIAPTIDVDKKTVRQGDIINIFGQTVPDSEVKVHINSEQEFIETAKSTEEGGWTMSFDTTPLEEEFHTAKALFSIASEGNILSSGFSKSISFAVGKVGGEAVCPEADLNADGRVNITDFSILLFHWGSDNACADQNQNGTVDLIDFSIMMYYWSG